MPDKDRVPVSIPKELAERVSKETGGRFPSLDDSVTFLLERSLRSKSEAADGGAEFSSEEKKAIEDRLKSLGYM